MIELFRQYFTKGFGFGTGLMAVLFTAGLLAVAVNSLTTFTSGTLVKASEVNANFAALKAAIEGIPSGTFCGLSSSTFTGNMGGYTAAKSTCVNTCGNSNAHMCSAHEVSISSQQGLLPASFGWFSGGVNAIGDSSFQLTDCQGFTSASNTIRGTLWHPSLFPWRDTCDQSYKILCCL